MGVSQEQGSETACRVAKFFSESIVLSELAGLIGLERIVTIYVGNLSFEATEEDLQEIFSEYGKVSRVSLPIDRETGKKRGFAFVEMEEESKEDAAIADLDGAQWLGRSLKVNKAKPREPRRGGNGDRTGGNFTRQRR